MLFISGMLQCCFLIYLTGYHVLFFAAVLIRFKLNLHHVDEVLFLGSLSMCVTV